ncbi:MAG: S41 family peptidase [Deltaproteobacteria bacterium]|nr:S41 family peptidase [Deltaproteobacteria bacterium]
MNPRSCRRTVLRMSTFIFGLIFLVVGLWSVTCSPPAQAASTQTYAQLRLLMEALYEVDNKYVGQKKDANLIYGAIRGMVMSLDPSSSFLTPTDYQQMQAGNKGPIGQVGVELTFKNKVLTVVAPLEGGPAWRAGIRAGDHILKINNQMVRDLTTMEAARLLQGVPGSTIDLQIIRNGMIKPQDISIKLEKLSPVSLSHYTLENDYDYLRLKYFNDRTADELERIIRKIVKRRPPVKGVILDLRNTAGGSLEQAIASASVFIGDSMVFYTRGRHQEAPQPRYGQKKERLLRNIPLVVLVDGGTARAAEILAGALQDQYGALLLGFKTFGDGAVHKVFPLKDGSALIFTVAHCFTPSGHIIQDKGLEPKIMGITSQSSKIEKAAGDLELTQPREILNAKDLVKDPLILQALKLLGLEGSLVVEQPSANLPSGARGK